MPDKLKHILEDMVEWREISQVDADLIWNTVRFEMEDKIGTIQILHRKIEQLELELNELKKLNPKLVEQNNRRRNNDGIILQWRLKKGKE